MQPYKFKLHLLLFVFLTINVSAQNNGGFENWAIVNGYEEPVDWQTFNIFSVFGNPICATKVGGVDKYAGNYALKITSKYLPIKIVPQQPDTIGFAFNGKITISPPSYAIGSPYTNRPQKLSFYAKYIPVGIDNGYSGVVLYSNLPTGRDTIADGTLVIAPNATYAQYQILLNYRSNAVPDSANIYFQASNSSNGKRVGSSLFIDEVKFVDFVGVEEYNLNATKVKVFPNPASDILTICTEIEEAYKVEVTDIIGRTINSFTIQNYEAKINVSNYKSGNYYFKILDKKNKPLTYGKFSVQK
jgi:hypothetical protein